MPEEYTYYATNMETGKSMTVLPFNELMDVLRYKYERLSKDLDNAIEDNKALRDEHYKDATIEALQARLDIMEKQYHRGFPISEQEEHMIETWKVKHDIEDHGYDTFEKLVKAEGVSCGRYSYHFYPTAIGICGEIHCSCGAKFEFQSI